VHNTPQYHVYTVTDSLIVLIIAQVHQQLVAYTSFSSEMVVGPALMALVHLSLLPNTSMRQLIVGEGVLPHLLKVLVSFDSKLILAQSCKLLASLALHSPNKLLIVTSGCLHGVVDLILGSGKNVSDGIHSVLCHHIQGARTVYS
jgi:hypothetical protein